MLQDGRRALYKIFEALRSIAKSWSLLELMELKAVIYFRKKLHRPAKVYIALKIVLREGMFAFGTERLQANI